MITTGRRAEPRRPPAVSLVGSLAAAAGALAIGLSAGVFAAWGALSPGLDPLRLAGAVTLARLAGAFADSLLGATLQAGYSCPACRKRTERRRHACGTSTDRVAGHPWLTNDAVNFLAALMGAAVAAATGKQLGNW